MPLFTKIAVGFGSLLLASFGAVALLGQGNSPFATPPGQINQTDDFLRSESDIRLIKKNLIVDGDIFARGNLQVLKNITTEDQRIIIDSASRQVLFDTDVTIGGSPEQLTVKGDLNVRGNAFFDNNLFFNSSTSFLLPLDKLLIGGNSIVVAKLSADPPVASSTNGQIYYNSTVNKFRVFENGVWKDVIKSIFTFLEDFIGGFDITKFFTDKSNPAIMIDTSANNLRISISAALSRLGLQESGSLKSKIRLRGDFDMIVDYQLINLPQPTIGANFFSLFAQQRNEAGQLIESFSIDRIKIDDGFNGYSISTFTRGIVKRIASNDITGKLRIVRNGMRVTALFASGTSGFFTPMEDLLFGDNDIDIFLFVASSQSGNAVEAIFDNWQIQSDDFITP